VNSDSPIEAILASPPERDELVVQLFFRGGDQWGELYRDNGVYRLDVLSRQPATTFNASELLTALARALDELRSRLEG
jgi:hypothetical protein